MKHLSFCLNPAGHLLMNLLIQVVNVILLFGMLHLMTGAMWPSAMVAALFALHPLNVESVTWVAERENCFPPVRHPEFLHYDDYRYVAGNARCSAGPDLGEREMGHDSD